MIDQYSNMPQKQNMLNPLFLLAVKERVGEEDAAAIALPALCWLDAAKRGQCNASGCNHLTFNLIIGTYIAAHTRSKRYHDILTHAYSQLARAAARPGQLLALTTSEYQALRAAFSWYLRSLPMVEVGMLNMACKTAERMMGA